MLRSRRVKELEKVSRHQSKTIGGSATMRRHLGNSHLALTLVLAVLGTSLFFAVIVGSQEPAERAPARESAAAKRTTEPTVEDSKRARPVSPKAKGVAKPPAEKAPVEKAPVGGK